MNKSLVAISALTLAALGLASCGNSSSSGTASSTSSTAEKKAITLNKDKPLVFFNRQPSDPTT